MVKFTDEHKKEMSGGDFIPEGIHKVKIMLVVFDSTKEGKEYVEFTVTDSEEREGKARMWFTTDKAINFTFNIIRGIFVHNAPEAKKDETRTKFDAITDSEQLQKICEKSLIGKEAWYSVFKSDRTYIDNDGNTKNSYDKNITGYEPKPKSTTTSAPAQTMHETGGIKVVDDDGQEQLIAEF